MDMRRKQEAAKDILKTRVCDCAIVSDVIKAAMAMAMDWHDEDGCKIKQTVTVILASRLYQQLMVQIKHQVSEADANMAISFVNDMRKLADVIEDNCQQYMRETFQTEAFRRISVPQGVTIQ
jgi:hypothetical protein